MNNQIDEQALANYLKRDSELSQRYQAIEADEVPAELNQAILLRASQNVSTNKVIEFDKLRKWRRMTAPFAIAATLVLSISVVTRTYNEVPLSATSVQTQSKEIGVEVDLITQHSLPLEIELPVESAPANSPIIAPPKMDAAPSPVPAEFERQVDTSTTLSATDKREQSVQAATSAIQATAQSTILATTLEEKPTAPESLASLNNAVTQPSKLAKPDQKALQRSRSDRDELSEIVVTGARIQRKQTPFNPHSAPTYVPSNQDMSMQAYEKEQRESDPTAWLNYIRELRIADKRIKANSEWKRFIKAYPNYEVALDDIARGGK